MKSLFPCVGLVLAALLSSCAQLDPAKSRADVTAEVSQRLQLEAFPEQQLSVEQQQALLAEWLAQPLDQQNAVRIALLQSPRVRSALLQLDLAEARRVQAGLIQNPVLELEWRDEHGPSVREASISQELLDLVWLPRRRDLAALDQLAAERAVAESLVDTASGVQAAWIAAVAAEQRLQLAEEVSAMGRSLAEITAALMDAGNLSPADQARLLLRAEGLARADLAASAAQLQRREHLQLALGIEQAVSWDLPAGLPLLPRNPDNPEALAERAVQSSLALAEARQRSAAEAVRLGIDDHSAWLQHLEGGWKVEREEGEWVDGPVLALSIPLFDTGRAARAGNQARLAILEADYRASELALRSQARVAARQLQLDYQQASDWVDVLLPAARALRETAWRDYNAMQLDLVGLLEAEVAWLETRMQFSQVLEQYWQSHLRSARLLAGAAPDGNSGESSRMAAATVADNAGEGH